MIEILYLKNYNIYVLDCCKFIIFEIYKQKLLLLLHIHENICIIIQLFIVYINNIVFDI